VIASELGLEGYRTLRRDRLIDAILSAQGGEEAPAEPQPDAEPELPEETMSAEELEPDEVPAEEALEAPPEPAAPAAEPASPAGEEEPEVVEERASDEEMASGVLDILPNGSGFLRVEGSGHSRGDVYVSPAQIRRCELRSGDEVSGPARPPKRNERHPSLIRVEMVNGGEAEPPEQRPSFNELTAVFASRRLEAPPSLAELAYGRGSRVAIAGPPGAGATALLREIAATLAERHDDLELQVVLTGVRPEEVGEWRDQVAAPLAGGGFDRMGESQAQAAELAVERAKRKVERGAHAAIVIDTLEALPPAAQRRLFGAARATEEGGTLTVFASVGEGSEALRWATTRVVLEPAGADGAPSVAGALSGTLRADRLS
jgi:transcription termination factor Rho